MYCTTTREILCNKRILFLFVFRCLSIRPVSVPSTWYDLHCTHLKSACTFFCNSVISLCFTSCLCSMLFTILSSLSVSLLMNSNRLPTLLFASTKSCLIKTGPMSLNTFASSSSFSSSCEGKKNCKSKEIDEMRVSVRSWCGFLDSGRHHPGPFRFHHHRRTLRTMSFSLYCCTNCWRLFMFRLRSGKRRRRSLRSAPRPLEGKRKIGRQAIVALGASYLSAAPGIHSPRSRACLARPSGNSSSRSVSFHACDAGVTRALDLRAKRRLEVARRYSQFFKFACLAASSFVRTSVRGLSSAARTHQPPCSTPWIFYRPRARWVRYGYARFRDAPRARPPREDVFLSPLPFSFLLVASVNRTRLTSPSPRARTDPGPPAEPRVSSEPPQIRLIVGVGCVQHHHEASLAAGAWSPAPEPAQ